MALPHPCFTRAARAAAFCVVLAGCQTVAPPPPAVPSRPPPRARAVFTPAAWSELPGWNDDRVAAAWPAFVVGCRALLADPRKRAVWQAPCTAGAQIDGADEGAVRAFFLEHFSPYRVAAADGADMGLVTGYYEPLLTGSRTRTDQFAIALYAQPDDLLTVDLSSLFPELKDKRVRGRVDGRKVVPYWTRADLEAVPTRLAGKALVYVADPVEAFFLEIQGSGRIELADGTVLRLNYADQNGHPYKSIGARAHRPRRTARRSARRCRRSARGRRRIRTRRARCSTRIRASCSFAKFRRRRPGRSTRGSTDRRARSACRCSRSARSPSIRARFRWARRSISRRRCRTRRYRCERLVLAQDTGGAIRGVVRADFFWGFGPRAGQYAGRMRQQGRMWLLWPKGAAPG